MWTVLTTTGPWRSTRYDREISEIPDLETRESRHTRVHCQVQTVVVVTCLVGGISDALGRVLIDLLGQPS